jgi:hypothetical protein
MNLEILDKATIKKIAGMSRDDPTATRWLWQEIYIRIKRKSVCEIKDADLSVSKLIPKKVVFVMQNVTLIIAKSFANNGSVKT